MTNEEYRQLRGTENPFAATPEQIDTAVKAIHECTDVVKATLAMLNDRAAAQMTP